MTSSNKVFDALLHLGNIQMRSGLFDAAIDTFSAAQTLEGADDRALRAREAASTQLKQFSPGKLDGAQRFE